MKNKLAILLLLGLLLLGGYLVLRSRNGKPDIPVVPEGSAEAGEPSSPIPTTSPNQPGSFQPVETIQATAPFLRTSTATTILSTPGTDRLTPATATPGFYVSPELVQTERFVGITPTPAGRPAPDYTEAPLEFTQIRLYASDSSQFAGIANVKNTGEKFINNLALQWRIEDKNGSILDQGTLTWPNLAPGETATIQFAGMQPYSDSWEKVVFNLEP